MVKKAKKTLKNRPPHYLRHWREFRRMTQGDLADKAGTTKGVISLLENGERRLSDKWARRLAPLLKVQPGWLLDHDPESMSGSVLEIWSHIPQDRHSQALEVLKTFAKKAS
jgi:transcriptional regulator with XRE-family HTH domain